MNSTSQPRESLNNRYIVPEFHPVPSVPIGWIKTFDEYYQSQTRSILNQMTGALLANPNLTFIWSEISLLDAWWEEQDQPRKEQFRKCVTIYYRA